MSYMIAKCVSIPGSIALKNQPKNIESDVYYLEDLTAQWLDKGIQILTVGNFEVHAEYKPVIYAKNRKEFEKEIEEMYLKKTEAMRIATNNDFDGLIRHVADKNDGAFKELTKYEEKGNDLQ